MNEVIESPKALGARGVFLLTLILLVLTDLAILLDIPILRPALGFLFFTIIPGLLILHILKLNKLGLTEKIILSVGLSVSFLMFFGLIVNSASLALSYTKPLSTTPLVISFSAILLILVIVAYLTNRTAISFNLADFHLGTKEKTFLLLPAFFPLLSISGMRLMNTASNNIMLMVMLFLIPAYIVLIATLHHRVPQRTYPAMIFLISVSLLLLVSLRSSHIMGHDTHNEYYLFQLVANSQHWQIFTRSILDACLSITLLPTIYQSLTNINSEYLFKILYSLLVSISPLIIYIISKKYIGNFYAFLTSFFFMSQFFFLWTPVHARINTALVFFALIIMVLYSDNINELAKKFLIIIFAASCIVSHYATTYIFFFILLLTWIGMQILTSFTLRKRKPVASSGDPITESHPLNSSQGTSLARDNINTSEGTAPSVSQFQVDKGITITFVMLFFVVLFLWYSQIAAPTFKAGVTYISRTVVNLNQMFLMEARGQEVLQASGQLLPQMGFAAKLKFVYYWLGIIFIAIGVLSTLVRYWRMVSIPGLGHDKPNFLKSKIDAEYWVLSLVCCAILLLSVVLPYALIYGMGRTFLQMMVVLSPFFIIGSIVAARLLKSKPYWLILVILIPYFMCNSGTIDRIFGVPGAVILSSEGPSYAYYYTYDQEGYAARWLRDNANLKDTLVYADSGGAVRLISQGGITGLRGTPIRGGLFSLLQKEAKIDGYIYLTYHNVVNRELVAGGTLYSITEYQDKFTEKEKIYTNGGSEIYR